MTWSASAWDKKDSEDPQGVQDDELTHLVEQARPKQLILAGNDVNFLVAHKLRFMLTLVIIAVSASAVTGPSTQFVKLTFFAVHYGGGDCQLHPSSDPCRRASSDVAVYHGVSSAIAHSIAWLFALMLGSFSDGHGRRPILLTAGCLSLIARFSLAMHLMGGISLWVFLVVEPVLTIFDVHGVFLAVMNDVVKDHKQRIVANSITMGVILGSGALAGLVGAGLPAHAAVIVSMILGCGQIFFLIHFFPETVPVRLRGGMENIRPVDLNPWVLVQDSAQILFKNKFVTRMTLILVFTGLSATGFHNTFLPYLAAYMGFDQRANGHLMLFGGISILWAFVLGMRPLIVAHGELGATRLLLALKVTFYTLCAAAWSGSQVYMVYLLLFGPVVLLIPIMAAIQSNLVNDEEQGRMQGILTAVKVLATAVGEVFFTWFYKHSTDGGADPRRVSALPPLLASVFLGVVAFALASSVDQRHVTKNSESMHQMSMSSL